MKYEVFKVVNDFISKQTLNWDRGEPIYREIFPEMFQSVALCEIGYRVIGPLRVEIKISVPETASIEEIIDQIYSSVSTAFAVTLATLSNTAIVFSMRTAEHFKLNVRLGHPFLMLDAERLRSLSEVWLKENLDFRGQIVSAKDHVFGQTVVDFPSNVMSHEWSQVIFVLCSESFEKICGGHAADYIACSRCTAQLFVVQLTVGKPPERKKEKRGKRDTTELFP